MERIKQIEKLLRGLGFIYVSQAGSHKKWKDPATGLIVIITYHQNKIDKYQARNTMKDVNNILNKRKP